MDFRDRHIVVSGGAGALGTAVVEALAGAGAICHVPCLHEAEKQSCRLQESKNVRLAVAGNLADEAVVARFYQGIAPLWASIHIAGGFAMAPLRDTTAELLRQQLDMNFVSCALCCRAAVNAMTAGGRIVNVSARAGLEWRSGAGMVAYTASKAAVAALTAALAEEVAKDGILVNAVAPSIMDTRGQSAGDAQGRLRAVAEGRRGRGDDRISRLAGKPRHPRRHRVGLRQVLITRP